MEEQDMVVPFSYETSIAYKNKKSYKGIQRNKIKVMFHYESK